MTTSTIDRDVRRAVAGVQDPEIPISLQDLGVVREVSVVAGHAYIRLRPTRTACPGREIMAARVRQAATAAGATEVTVVWEAADWHPGAITAVGCRALRAAGYSAAQSEVACPYCASKDVRRTAEFGGAVCRLPYSCTACGSPFDVLAGAVRSQ